MKAKHLTTTTLGILSLAIAAGEARGETAADIGILPSQKIPASVDKGDRNPFSTRHVENNVPIDGIDTESEESRIRQVFAGLRVTGHVPASKGSPRVLVGDLILKEGIELPQVIENQTNVLRVTRITNKEVEITWIDEEVAEAPRKLLIPINLEPEVSFLLPGRSSQVSSQFVKMSKAEKEAMAGAAKPQVNDPLVNEAEQDDDRSQAPSKREQPEKNKRVSPFGLFRR
ncbi:MAG: hypothetical protein ACR2RV_07170 [Verrucomicrobiales bacterium]